MRSFPLHGTPSTCSVNTQGFLPTGVGEESRIVQPKPIALADGLIHTVKIRYYKYLKVSAPVVSKYNAEHSSNNLAPFCLAV